MLMPKQFCMLGLGYIGLPTAVALAQKNQSVLGVDINPVVVDRVNKGLSLVTEPSLAAALLEVVQDGLLKASETVEPADVYIIAVPTPFKEGFTPDISYVEAAAQAIAPFLKKGDLVILESTSPVGTTRKIAEKMAAMRPDLIFPLQEGAVDIHVAYCPERVLPGKILYELVHNNRIVGGMTTACTVKAAKVYNLFVTGEITHTTDRHAEMAKLCENAFRDVNIAFANELSMICDELKLNVWEVIKLANKHPRVNILNPGPGVGGHCIAVDPWFIVDAAPKTSKLIRTAREVNLAKTRFIIEQIKMLCKQHHTPARVACLGLSFKANVDDLRESPALEIVESIAQKTEAFLYIVEPFIEKLPASLENFKKIKLATLPDALSQCNIVVLLVDHLVFESIEKTSLQHKVVLDTRGLLR